jgi:CO/xanthine dehydrogenase Mo-binding subunit
VGGGFGAKQEMLTEELCVLATLRTGCAVKWEFTRSEEFIGAVSRHPMKVTIKLGAKKDGTLTAMQIRNISNTGAYGNHGGATLAASLGSSIMTYRCPNKKGQGYAVYTNVVPSGAFRGYGATQTSFAVESAIDEVARQLGIDAAAVLNTTAANVEIVVADTDKTPYDTGTFASVGISVSGLAVEKAASALKDHILEVAAPLLGVARADCQLTHDAVVCGELRLPLAGLGNAAPDMRHKLQVSRKAYATPRFTAFYAHGFRVAIHRVTGEVRILQSVQGIDCGTLINPMQCHGQAEGAIAQGIGSTLFERMVIDEKGAVVNQTFRNYRIPAFADIPRTEIFFAKTHEPCGPLGAKSLAEAPIIPVSAALGNAIADATGVRFTSLPFSADRIFAQLAEAK